MIKISEIPAKKFPLRFEKYLHIEDEIRRAAEGFAKIDNPDGRLISDDLNQVLLRFNQTWNLIRMIELREQNRL